MEQVIAVFAGAILAGCIPLAVAFTTKIDPKFSQCIQKRKRFLDTNFILTVNKPNSFDSIDPYLPWFREHETIKEWKDKRNSINDLIIFTVIFTILGLALGVVNVNYGTPIPLENLLVISGGFFFAFLIFRMLNLHKKMQNWEENQKYEDIALHSSSS